MHNKRTRRTRRKEYTGIIESHINDNLKNYIIITIIFLAGVILRSIIYKQCK